MRYANSISVKLSAFSNKCIINHPVILTWFFHERLLLMTFGSNFWTLYILKVGILPHAVQGYTTRLTIVTDFYGSRISNELEAMVSSSRQSIAVHTNGPVVFIAESLPSSAINIHKPMKP